MVALLLCSSAAMAQTGLTIDDPIQWAGEQSRPIKPAKLLAGEQWQSYRSNLVASEGHYAHAKVAYLEPRVAEIVTQSNKAFDTARKLKGAAVEHLMDDFYAKDGWEKLPSKVGPQGIDGLYVKRSPKGRILSWFVAEAKSGTSKLGMTKYGKQLSPEWIGKKLQDLETAYSKNPTPENLKNLEDVRALKTATQRASREFRVEITKNADGKTVCRITQTFASGKRAAAVTDVDMTKVKNNPMRKKVLDYYAKAAVEDGKCSVAVAKKMVKALDVDFQQGVISSDSDAWHSVKKSIDKVSKPASVRAKSPKIASRFPGIKGVGAIALASEGTVILINDLINDRLSWQTAGAISMVAATTVSVPLLTQGAGTAAQRLASFMGYADDVAKTAAGATTKTLGGVFSGVAFAVGTYQMWDYISEYNNGNMTRQDMLVKTSLAAIPVAYSVAVAATTTILASASAGASAGATAGSAGGPIGTGIGIGIGVGLGALCGVGIVVYDYFTAEARQAAILVEERHWAEVAEARLREQRNR